jgi:cellulose synthase/poly-beta-1,6-N-acetylglucosamine synthase-like glycosyltransferase
MKYVFLTACRNEELTLDDFVTEFAAMVASAGIAGRTVLYVVDDLSTDRTREVIWRRGQEVAGFSIRTILAPTNLGNQGAMFYGLGRIEVEPQDVLVTFDSDGEDDVGQIPSILQIGASNPAKLVLIERGRRTESLRFKFLFAGYKTMFRFLTRQEVVPNNFMLIPGNYVSVVRRSPLAAVHLAYGILKLNTPRVTVTRDRRPRYGGKSSQNLFMLVSHGLVGLMVFYEIVIAKLFMLLFGFGAFAMLIVGLAVALPSSNAAAQRTLIWVAIAASIGAIGFCALLLAAALVVVFKLGIFMLSQSYAERPIGPTPRPESESAAAGDVPDETRDKKAN